MRKPLLWVIIRMSLSVLMASTFDLKKKMPYYDKYVNYSAPRKYIELLVLVDNDMVGAGLRESLHLNRISSFAVRQVWQQRADCLRACHCHRQFSERSKFTSSPLYSLNKWHSIACSYSIQ